MDKHVDIELEQVSIHILLCVFAACVRSETPATIVYQDEDYYLLAKRVHAEKVIYEIGLWRTCSLESETGALFSVANFPGVVGASYTPMKWNSIHINREETRAIYGPMCGVQAIFAYPDDEHEIENFKNRALDGVD